MLQYLEWIVLVGEDPPVNHNATVSSWHCYGVHRKTSLEIQRGKSRILTIMFHPSYSIVGIPSKPYSLEILTLLLV